MKEKIIEIKNKVKQLYNWYIKGEYHCDECRYCWEEWSYEGDGDCGCYIKGDIQDTCRLLPPFKNIIGYFKKRKCDYYMDHKWDGYDEFCQEQDKKELFLREKINEHIFKEHEFYVKGTNGEFIPVNTENNPTVFSVCRAAAAVVHDYDGMFHPVIYKSLSQKWKELLKDTFDSFTEKFKPYFGKEE